MAEKEENQDDAELVVVTDDPKNLDVEPGKGDDEDLPEPKKGREEADGKGKAKTDADTEEDEDQEESRLGASEETEQEEEDKKRKSDHKSRRQRRKEAENRLRTELKFLEARNDKLERQLQEIATRQDTSEKSNLETRLAQTKALIKKAESVIAEAASNNKGDEMVEATRIRDGLRDQERALEIQRTRANQEPPEKKAPMDPRVAKNIQGFHSKYDWFDFARRDYDSKLVGAIDDAVASEGYDPATPDYWKELDKRIAEILPHRAAGKKAKVSEPEEDEDDEDEEPTPKTRKKNGEGKEPLRVRQAPGGPKFRTGNGGKDLKPGEVYLSKERVEALKEAGAWDDPKIRAKYLKKYAEYDRQNRD